jgi:hypothetical protein
LARSLRLARAAGGDHDGAFFVSRGDDAKEQVCGVGRAGHVAKLIEDEKVGRGVAAEAPLDGRQSLVLQEVGQCGGERAEAHGVPLGEGGVAEVLCEGGLACAGLSAQQYVLAAGHEAERVVELLEERSVDTARVSPVEAVEWLDCLELGRLGARGEVSRVALALLEGSELEAELRGGQLALGGVREEGANGIEGGSQSDGMQGLGGVIGDRHRSLRGRGGRRLAR